MRPLLETQGGRLVASVHQSEGANPSGPAWDHERRTTAGVIEPELIRIMGSAVDQIEAAAAEDLVIGVNWSLVNQGAADWARAHAAELAQGLTDTTRVRVRGAIADWVEQRGALGELVDTLRGLLTGDPAARRAELIGITEVTGIYARANVEAWRRSDAIRGQRFNTSRDDRVCFVCRPLDGLVFEVGKAGAMPALHGRCRCWLSPISIADTSAVITHTVPPPEEG